jgi:hypothetical protein
MAMTEEATPDLAAELSSLARKLAAAHADLRDEDR